MPETLNDRVNRWRMQELLRTFPGLRLRPSSDGSVVLAGPLAFTASDPTGKVVDDEYQVRISVPTGFPTACPSVWETGGRIPQKFHKLTDGSLCLGSPTRIRLHLQLTTTLPEFVKNCVIPYLYGRSYFERHGEMPFGELDHGAAGIRQDLATLFGTKEDIVVAFTRLTGMKKRQANKHPCPCGSGHRLGRCHNKTVNRLREQLGRRWFQHLKNSLQDPQ